MGVLDKIGGLLGGGLGGKIADIVGSRIENKAEAAKAVHELEMAIGARAHELEMALVEQTNAIAAEQSKTNQIEAASDSLFKSGWRPMVGWVCVGGLAYQLVAQPLITWLSTIYSWMPPPSLAMDTLLTLLFGILGLGAYRTYEKTR